jgi:hypothetical protein
MMVYHRGKYSAFKVSSILHCRKTMKNSCRLTLLTDSFRQLDQKQSVDNFVLLFEVHITFGYQSEVPPLLTIFSVDRCIELRHILNNDSRSP